MAKLIIDNANPHYPLIKQLYNQLNDLSGRCLKLDSTIKQTENHSFAFEVHLFSTRCLSLAGYISQIEKTFSSLQGAINKKLPDLLIKHECELFVGQFNALLQLVKGLEKGEAELLYNSYSTPKELIYQQLQKQYQYEKRLLDMIGQQEELLVVSEPAQKSYIKEKIEALKIRYQKCNSFTQKLEFKFEESNDE